MISKNQLLRIKYNIGNQIGRNIFFFRMWRILFRSDVVGRLVSDQTDAVVEGFPRSGNTFAVAAFTLAQQNRVLLAHHTHKVCQIKAAVEKEIPTLLLIRNPRDAVASLIIRYPYLLLPQALKSYIQYYTILKEYQTGFFVAPFSKVISDFGYVIRGFNNFFRTRFTEFQHNDDNVNTCFELIEDMHKVRTGKGVIIERSVARPSVSREVTKIEILEGMQSAAIKPLMDWAESLYAGYLELVNI